MRGLLNAYHKTYGELTEDERSVLVIYAQKELAAAAQQALYAQAQTSPVDNGQAPEPAVSQTYPPRGITDAERVA